MSWHVIDINTILHTKDGSIIGNAIVTGKNGCVWEVTTDYGNTVRLSEENIHNMFKVGWEEFTIETHGISCEEMQRTVSIYHKYRV